MTDKIAQLEWRADVLQARADALTRPDADPCWDGYEQPGTKEKDGKTVPNCVESDAKADETRSDGQSVGSYVKQEYSAGRRPDLTMEGVAGSFYLMGGGKALDSSPSTWGSREAARDALFRYLDKGRKHI